MGISDSFKDRADQAVDKVGADRVKDGAEKAGDKADEMTGGRFAKHVDRGQSAAGEYVDGRDGDDAPN